MLLQIPSYHFSRRSNSKSLPLNYELAPSEQRAGERANERALRAREREEERERDGLVWFGLVYCFTPTDTEAYRNYYYFYLFFFNVFFCNVSIHVTSLFIH
jgi:hypothetical protein